MNYHDTRVYQSVSSGSDDDATEMKPEQTTCKYLTTYTHVHTVSASAFRRALFSDGRSVTAIVVSSYRVKHSCESVKLTSTDLAGNPGLH